MPHEFLLFDKLFSLVVVVAAIVAVPCIASFVLDGGLPFSAISGMVSAHGGNCKVI